MSREEFIGKLEMVYVGDRNAFNDIVCAYDSLLVKNEKAIEMCEPLVEWGECTINGKILKQIYNILQNGSDENVK